MKTIEQMHETLITIANNWRLKDDMEYIRRLELFAVKLSSSGFEKEAEYYLQLMEKYEFKPDEPDDEYMRV